MSEEIVLLYPPNNFLIEPLKPLMKKDLEIIMYNKTEKNILYKVNSDEKNNLKIKNSFSILKPLSSFKIIITLENNTNKDLNDVKNKILFSFYLLNKDISSDSDLNRIINEKMGKENQANEVTIDITNKSLNIDERYIQKYIKFKNDLNDVNKKIQNIIGNSNEHTINKNKYIFIIVLLLIIIFSGFLFGLKLSALCNRLFKKKTFDNQYSSKGVNNKNDKEFVEIKFMSVKEVDEIKELNDENLLKYNQINNFNIFNAVKQNKESNKIKYNYNKKKEVNNTNKKEDKKKSSFIRNILKYIIIFFLFTFLIY
jgi:hypothetical protein